MYEPNGWTHVSGYRLNADGKSIKYEQENGNLQAAVEASLNEYDAEESFMEYIPSIIDPDTGFVEHPEVFEDASSALDRLREMMADHTV